MYRPVKMRIARHHNLEFTMQEKWTNSDTGARSGTLLLWKPTLGRVVFGTRKLCYVRLNYQLLYPGWQKNVPHEFGVLERLQSRMSMSVSSC
jgi:hypothetical protein